MTTDTKPTYTESVEALTGFDEIAIEKTFKHDLDSLRFSMQLRALVFVASRRNGANDKDAYEQAMSLTVKDLNGSFSPEQDEEIDEDEPETPMGEGDSSAD